MIISLVMIWYSWSTSVVASQKGFWIWWYHLTHVLIPLIVKGHDTQTLWHLDSLGPLTPMWATDIWQVPWNNFSLASGLNWYIFMTSLHIKRKGPLATKGWTVQLTQQACICSNKDRCDRCDRCSAATKITVLFLSLMSSLLFFPISPD